MYQPKKSYSQTGEDILIKNILDNLQIKKPNYLDIGAYHPVFISNTYMFYKNGSRGVLIEPDQKRVKSFLKKRPRDIFINAGVGDSDGKVNYYSCDSMSTFSEPEKNYLEKKGYVFNGPLELPILGINNLLDKYFPDGNIDFVSIDTEGFEMTILGSWDFNKYRPKVLCVEAVEHSPNLFLVKKCDEVVNFLTERNYKIFADTMNNLILVDGEVVDKESLK